MLYFFVIRVNTILIHQYTIKIYHSKFEDFCNKWDTGRIVIDSLNVPKVWSILNSVIKILWNSNSNQKDNITRDKYIKIINKNVKDFKNSNEWPSDLKDFIKKNCRNIDKITFDILKLIHIIDDSSEYLLFNGKEIDELKSEYNLIAAENNSAKIKTDYAKLINENFDVI